MAVRNSDSYYLFLLFTTICFVEIVFCLKTFQEPCDADCDERLGLFCNRDSVCECMNTNVSIFDSKQGRCVSRAGFPCSRFGSELFCVEHATCENVNLPCNCKRNYFQTRNGTCTLMAKFNENCSIKKQCDTASGIECVDKKCQCKYPEDQIYHSRMRKCISYAGGNCSFSLPCVANADCSQDIFELRQGLNVHGKPYRYNATVGRKCSCRDGFTQTFDRKCQATLYQFCNSTTPCNSEENLACIDNICLCKHPFHQLYNQENQKCLNLVGVHCTSGNSDCGPNSECIDSKCQCKTGYSVTSDRNCLKDYRENCKENECNVFNGLSCRNHTCECIDEFLIYDKTKQACVGSEIGSLCGVFNIPHVNKQSPGTNIFIGCKDDMKCEKIHGDTYIAGRHLCF